MKNYFPQGSRCLKKIFLTIFILSFIVLKFASPAESLDLNYDFVLQGDGGSKPHIILEISNNNSDTLNLVISKPFIDSSGNLNPNLVTMIHNISAIDSDGNLLQTESSQNADSCPNLPPIPEQNCH